MKTSERRERRVNPTGMKFPGECCFFLDNEPEIHAILDYHCNYLDMMDLLLGREEINYTAVSKILYATRSQMQPIYLSCLKIDHSSAFSEFLYDLMCKQDMTFRRQILEDIARISYCTVAPENRKFIENLRAW